MSVSTVLRRTALVALGGMLGTAARMGLGMLIPDAALGVLAANIVGALALGMLTARLPAGDLVRILAEPHGDGQDEGGTVLV